MSTNELAIESDDRLVARFRSGDPRAFDDLVAIHISRLYAIAYQTLRQREDAEEIAQEVLVSLYRQITGPSPPRAVRPWLYRVCINACINWQRARKRQVATVSLTEDITTAGADQVVLENGSGFSDYVRAAVACLPEQQRMAFTLCHFAGLSTEEIAEALRCRPATVRVHLSRATLRLREILSEEMRRDEILQAGS